MEKVYMELPKKNLRVWKNDDISPYDFRDDIRNESRNEVRNERYSNDELRNDRYSNEELRNDRYSNDDMRDRYNNEEDEYDMDAIMDELDRLDDEMRDECNPESDMYDNGNIDWRCNEDISQNMREMHIERKMIVEEENPKRKTTTWMRVTRVY